MISILLLTFLGADASDYFRIQHPQSAAAVSDYYQPPPRAAEKEIEEDEKPATIPDPPKPAAAVADRRRVIVYVDLSDVRSFRKIVDDADGIQGIDIAFKDKSDIPESGRKYQLPLLHFSAGSGRWGFRSGWNGAAEFVTYWSSLNRDQNEGVPIGQSKAKVTHPQRSASGGYRAHSYEWHLTSGESANALRDHLSRPQPAHHGAYFDRAWLNTLSFHELVGLHSDAHNGRVQYQYVGKQVAASTDVAAVLTPKEQKKVIKELGRVVYGTRDGRHPGPLGSSIRGWFGDPRYSRSSAGCPNGRCPYAR